MRLVRPLLCALAAITVAGCASGPDAGTAVSSTPVASPGAFKVCMVADEAGFSDGGINQLAYTGMMAAATDLKLLVGQAQADAQTDYAASIASLAAAQCTLIITVGQQHAGDADPGDVVSVTQHSRHDRANDGYGGQQQTRQGAGDPQLGMPEQQLHDTQVGAMIQ